MRALIAGCGYVGTELGLRLVRAGHEVWGLRRDTNGLPDSIHPVSADLLDPSLSERLESFDRVIYAASADASSPERYRDAYVLGVKNLLGALEAQPVPPKRFVFISSTAVYGEAKGEWVDEGTPPSPTDFRGREVLMGEKLVRGSEIRGICLRLGGIYGPGRNRLIEMVRAGRAECPPGPPRWSNRIHRDDAAGAAAYLLKTGDPEPVYIGVDDEPAPICDVYRHVAQLLGAPEPVVGWGSGPSRSNKRCSNRLLRESGYQFTFPTYREGYRALVAQVSEGGEKDSA